MTSAAAVAKHLIRLAAADPEGEPMTAMRLHKLLYYCQGWFLAWHGRPLFPDRLEAWKYGPVVPAVYAEPWGQGRELLPVPDGPADLPTAEREAVEQVWSHYRRFSACGLRDKTHDEPPWKNHYSPDANARCSAEIPVPELATFFNAELRRQTGEDPAPLAAVGPGTPLDQAKKELGW